LLLTYPNSSSEPLPEPETLEEEEIQLPELPFEFEEDLFKDFGNTSNYFHPKMPPVPNSPSESLEEDFLRNTIRELTTIMSLEWIKKVEFSSEAIQIYTLSSTIQCQVQGTTVNVLYNPTVGETGMSASFVSIHLWDKPPRRHGNHQRRVFTTWKF
jgi:hypothetical protein